MNLIGLESDKAGGLKNFMDESIEAHDHDGIISPCRESPSHQWTNSDTLDGRIVDLISDRLH
jgi:hypothetical protein